MKYICKDCPKPCEITVDDGSDTPMCCPYRLHWHAVNWHKADEPCEPTTNSSQLPDWCKVGKWVYCDSNDFYAKIVEINDKEIIGDTGNGAAYFFSLKNLHPTRLRPYNAEEMKALVGKVIEDKIGSRCLITVFTVVDDKIVAFNKYCSADDLLKTGYTINGKPCGILEHFDSEREEWME